MIKTIKLILTILLLFIFTACAGMQNPDMASIQKDLDSKKFTPTPGKSKIYIVRPSKFGGMGIYIHPTIDKMVTGNLSSGSYLMLEVLPGKHVISAAGDLDDPEDIKITTEADKLYFVKMYPKVRIGLLISPSPRLHNEIIGREEGQKLVSQNKRFKTIEYKALAQDLLSPEDKANLYIIRPGKLYGIAKKLSPTVDNIVVGTLESGSYVVTEVSPGPHKITAAGKYEGQHTFEFEASTEKEYFVKISPKMGFALPKLNIEMISPEEGKSLVGNYKQIQE